MIKVGIIGCGKIAQVRHIPEYLDNPHVKLHGFFDLNQARAQEIADQYDGRAYESCQALLNDPEIDAVSVLTPNFTHAEISIAALKAGKHVLCEKPMATTLAECEAMAETARTTGKKLMIAQNQRLAAAHQKAKELLRDGVIGDIITFQTSFAHSGADNWSVDGKNSWFMDRSRSCFGAMADLGVHKTDLMVYLMGSEIVRASAVIGTLQKKFADGTPISVDDNAFCTYIMKSGAIGTMKASWTDYGREENFTSIYGTTGVMHIYKDVDHAIVIERGGKEQEFFDTDSIQTNEDQGKSGIIDLFVKSIIEDEEPAISAEDVLPAMRAIFACAESAEQGGILVDTKGGCDGL